MLKQLFVFTIVGSLAFLLDVAVLYLLKSSLGLYFARMVSFFMAVVFTWMLNRNLTFKSSNAKKNLSNEFITYLLTMLGGGLVNYLSYVVLVTNFIFFTSQPIWAVAFGSCLGLVLNFLGSRFLVFKS